MGVFEDFDESDEDDAAGAAAMSSTRAVRSVTRASSAAIFCSRPAILCEGRAVLAEASIGRYGPGSAAKTGLPAIRQPKSALSQTLESFVASNAFLSPLAVPRMAIGRQRSWFHRANLLQTGNHGFFGRPWRHDQMSPGKEFQIIDDGRTKAYRGEPRTACLQLGIDQKAALNTRAVFGEKIITASSFWRAITLRMAGVSFFVGMDS